LLNLIKTTKRASTAGGEKVGRMFSGVQRFSSVARQNNFKNINKQEIIKNV
jgi:hypothetical protein